MTASRGPVVVITGASSGIGRSAAHAFARRGYRVVLAARSRESLVVVAGECLRLGAEATIVPTDVSDEAQVQHLARTAVERFGRIDVWVGNASVFGYGEFERIPADVFEGILRTNLLGQVHGARAVLPQFRRQGAGVLVVVGSLYSKVPSPLASPYITSKFGTLGFALALRQELRRERDIHVRLVLPATIDTPIYQHAANYTGSSVHPLPPIVSAKRVARAIVKGAERRRRVRVVGRLQGLLIPAYASAPWLLETFVPRLMPSVALREPQVAAASGTVFEPDPTSNAVSGGWRSAPVRLLALGAAGVGATLLLRRRK
ncbi:SDR family NAD(P)-dependent oxidoreductase [Herbiconiux sp. SYSU D00978]|uniref:SDR family NAD(P)-dependent oxidoreductase n=1 Tax=Herbiconiux sp. SYSU D00978 TaxID=2812562 RepID=UPI001A96A702|nr:SDR family NAD(P)-dependent oxidoreductase [Herbiconiux sp. SYSU D00978]